MTFREEAWIPADLAAELVMHELKQDAATVILLLERALLAGELSLKGKGSAGEFPINPAQIRMDWLRGAATTLPRVVNTTIAGLAVRGWSRQPRTVASRKVEPRILPGILVDGPGLRALIREAARATTAAEATPDLPPPPWANDPPEWEAAQRGLLTFLDEEGWGSGRSTKTAYANRLMDLAEMHGKGMSPSTAKRRVAEFMAAGFAGSRHWAAWKKGSKGPRPV